MSDMQPKKISFARFQEMLRDIDISDEEIAQYLQQHVGGRGGFDPEFRPDPEKVDLNTDDPLESAMSIGNGWCRWRRRKRFEERVRRGETKPVLVSEGDSWFQFPFFIKDVIDQLDKDYLIWSRGAAGDTAQNMVFDNPEYIDALDEQAERVEAFLFSAAGNDVIGEENGEPVLKRLLHPANPSFTKPRDYINKSELKRTIDKLKNAYTTVINTVRADARFEDLPILIHGYDYALPYPARARDPRRPKWADNNEWLGSPLDERGITDRATRRGIIKLLVDELYEMMDAIAADNDHVHVVNVRGTLRSVSDWADEIHATDAGYARVASIFHETLEQSVRPIARGLERMASVARSRDPSRALQASYQPIESPEPQIGKRRSIKLDTEAQGIPDNRQFGNAWARSRPSFEAAIGEDDSLGTFFLTAGAAAARAVCKIEAEGVDYRGRDGF